MKYFGSCHCGAVQFEVDAPRVLDESQYTYLKGVVLLLSSSKQRFKVHLTLKSDGLPNCRISVR